MSGHSHWANIQGKKGKEDAKRGKIFSRLSDQIIRAAKAGGTDPEFNVALRNAIDEAKKANMPRENIDRAVSHGAIGDGSGLESQILEGYGPSGVALLVRAETDNKNRTLAEVRKIFERNGGSLGEAGCSAYVFENNKPKFKINLDSGGKEAVAKLLAAIKEHSDVVEVLSNADLA